MKFLVIIIGIIATITYIFLSGPGGGLASRSGGFIDRRQEVWDRIGQLEAKRRDLLVRASMRLGGGLTPPARATRGGPWSQGYQAGFEQGYFVGSFLAEGRRPNPLFFPVPNP